MQEQVKKAVQDEYQAYYDYKQLIEQTESKEWLENLQQIAEDEKAHYEMFQQLYYLLTGDYVKELKKPIPFHNVKTFVQQAWEGELDATDHYKMMMLKSTSPKESTPFWIAMHDEMEHAVRLLGYQNYLNERS